MKQEILKTLKCSSCGAGLSISLVPDFDINKEEINYGIVKCNCKEYPIVDGILVMRDIEPAKKALEIIKNAKTKYSIQQSLFLLIERQFVRVLVRLLMQYERMFGRRPAISFWKLSTFIEDSRWAIYLKYRFSCPSFISCMALVPVFKNALSDGGKILDMGCGAGHLSFFLSRYIGEEKICCADKGFLNLYFARNYIVGKNASYICLDADEKIPFKDGCFSSVVSMDAFHYIDKKEQLAGEIKRVLKSNGTVFFIHIHNKYVKTIATGLPLTPEGYSALFPGYSARYFPEKYLVQNVFGSEGLDLSKDVDFEDVKKSDAISMVLTHNDTLLKKYDHLSAVPLAVHKDEMILNPLYMKVGSKFVRRFPSPFYEEEYYLINEFFPESVDADLPTEELKRKLILIPVPLNYKKEGERLYRFRLWR